ncbi:Uncharacterised protein [Legionella wadsworthii]|uniref:Transmembrane protein (Fibronectin III domain and Gp5 C-terminal repeat) n=1 Tax=Legionella wadsworthii TaxID=28088 RepID=A0A378LPY8_9GAMM|nr:hypothetical protein [Legionella wadsworthii]STY27859.1 Uncharacterised protein [Legionella wadsworthii]
MRRSKCLNLCFFLFVIIPIQLLWAQDKPETDEQANLTISTGKNGVSCSKSIQNCIIQVSQPRCQPIPGTVTITNNSRIYANNIQASSSNGYFTQYVIQNNGCPPSLAPGASCSISFITNTPAIAFLVQNIMVKGTNTNATFFDMQAVACPIQQAILSVTPTSVNLITGGPSKSVTVTNTGNIPAQNVHATVAPTPPINLIVSSNCPALLQPGASCQVTFTPDDLPGNTTATISGANTANTVTVRINVSLPPTTTLSVPATAVIPSDDSVGVIIPVTNLTAVPAHNVMLNLPPSWTGVTATTCPVIPGNGVCYITVTTSGFFNVYVAQGGILVTGDNVTSPPSMALAFSAFNYLVYEVTGSPALNFTVVSDTDINSNYEWSINLSNIIGINQDSTNPPDFCNGNSDGACDTLQIVEQEPNDTAAKLCDQITIDNSGLVPEGTWYLPASCQLGKLTIGLPNATDALCAPNTPNIATNLYSLGFLSEFLGNKYWSSTQYTPATSNAFYQEFFPNNQSTSGAFFKLSQLHVRCVRVFATV